MEHILLISRYAQQSIVIKSLDLIGLEFQKYSQSLKLSTDKTCSVHGNFLYYSINTNY